MKRTLLLQIARALMFARWRQTLVAAVGVTFSITMFVALLGFMNGLNGLLDGLILNRTPHVRLYNDIKPTVLQPIDASPKYSTSHNFIHSVKPATVRREIYNSAAILDYLSRDKRVLGVSPKVSAQVFYTLGNINLNGMVNGINAEAECRLFKFSDYVVEGNPLDINSVPNSIILGKGAANKLLAKIGDVVVLTTPEGNQFPLKVVGFYQSGLADYDKVQSFASIATTQRLLGKTNNYISDIQIKLNDLSLAPAVAKEYANLFGVDAEDIQTANAQFETGSHVRSIISYAVGLTLLIVAGFGIYNILNMMIYEKMDTIAILKATGFSGADVRRIFLTIAISIGLAGTLAGYVFGFLLSQVIDHLPFVTPALPTITTFPVDYNPVYYLIAGTFAILTTWFAGWFPARKASTVDPVVIIRGK